jgi:hypothetical protein
MKIDYYLKCYRLVDQSVLVMMASSCTACIKSLGNHDFYRLFVLIVIVVIVSFSYSLLFLSHQSTYSEAHVIMPETIGQSLTENTTEEDVEVYSSWALLILCSLLVGVLWLSYYLQSRRVRLLHETVVAILAGA